MDGTLQGAGGVGGLLAVVKSDSATNNSPLATGNWQLFLPTYDANGNISEYVTTNGDVVAHYDYSPFGETLIEAGDLASSFTHRFSTKPWCPVTGLYEYQMRKYRPEIGRWLSRDPIIDPHEINKFGFLCNNALAHIDYIGCAHIVNKSSDPILAVGNVRISESCRNYLMENIPGLTLGKNGINGVLFVISVGEESRSNSPISDIDGYWTAFSPGAQGHVEKIRRSHTITDNDLSSKSGSSISDMFLGGVSISAWISNTLDGLYRKNIENGWKKCQCNDSDINNIGFAIFSSTEAALFFPEAE